MPSDGNSCTQPMSPRPSTTCAAKSSPSWWRGASPKRRLRSSGNLQELAEDVKKVFGLDLPIVEWAHEEGIAEEAIRERLEEATDRLMAAKAANLGPDLMRHIEKSVLIQLLDQVWKEHLLALDHLRQGISLRAYGQRDPLNEYKSEAFALFNAMLDELKERVTSFLARIDLVTEPPPPPRPPMVEQHPEPAMAMAGNGWEAAGGGDTMVLNAPSRSDSVDPSDPATLAQQSAQRAVSLRLRKEIQALPWSADVGDRGKRPGGPAQEFSPAPRRKATRPG